MFRNRECQPKACAVSGLAGYVQGAAVRVDDLGDDGQPQPHARLLGGEEWVEDLLLELRRNAGTGVLNLDHHLVPVSGNAVAVDSNAQIAALFAHGFTSIEEQVG